MTTPTWLAAGLCGLLAGAAPLIGAATAWFVHVPWRIVAAVVAFGSGALISALSVDLMDEAYRRGGFDSTATGVLGGAVVYTVANRWLVRRGVEHRKRFGDRQPSEGDDSGSGLALAVGALPDGVPESIVIGLGLLKGGAVSLLAVAAIFLSNIPEGLSSAAGMKRAGRPAHCGFGVRGGIAVVSGLAPLGGCALIQGLSPDVVAGTTAVAAGAILAMLADTMIPGAFEQAHDLAGLITLIGFLAAFVLGKIGKYRVRQPVAASSRRLATPSARSPRLRAGSSRRRRRRRRSRGTARDRARVDRLHKVLPTRMSGAFELRRVPQRVGRLLARFGRSPPRLRGRLLAACGLATMRVAFAAPGQGGSRCCRRRGEQPPRAPGGAPARACAVSARANLPLPKL